MNRLYILLAVLFANIALLSLVSCSDDDNGGGQPVIERVRTTDPALADSTFTDAMVGQMILIEGSNLHMPIMSISMTRMCISTATTTPRPISS